MEGLLLRWGASFLSVEGEEGCPWGGISFGGRGGFEKNRKMRGAPYGPTMGNPEKNHLTIKNNCSILKKQ